MDKAREQKLFMLRMFKFVYQLMGAHLPANLQTELEQFPNEEHSYFTDNISRAVVILMNERYDTRDLLAPIDSDHFVTIAREMAVNYMPIDFLKFCSWYTMKAASDPNREKSEDYKILMLAINKVFRIAGEDGGFNSDHWDTLEAVAARIVEDDYIKCRRLPNFDPNKKLDLEEEKSFVLRVMEHVFSLNFKELPIFYSDTISSLDEKDYRLSDNVKNALQCLLEIQGATAKHLGEDLVRDYYARYCFSTFKPKEFLEYCACFSRKAYEDYHLNNIKFTPYKVQESCLRVLQLVREKGLPVPWDEIEFAAEAIIQDYECRLQDEQARKARLDQAQVTEYAEHVPLIKAISESQKRKKKDENSESDLFEDSCGCCMCS